MNFIEDYPFSKLSSLRTTETASFFCELSDINLIDEIGVEDDAIEWLKIKAGLDDKVKIIDYVERSNFFDMLDLKFFKKISNMELKLTDGILAIWTP